MDFYYRDRDEIAFFKIISIGKLKPCGGGRRWRRPPCLDTDQFEPGLAIAPVHARMQRGKADEGARPTSVGWTGMWPTSSGSRRMSTTDASVDAPPPCPLLSWGISIADAGADRNFRRLV